MEAIRDCDDAVRIDPQFVKVHTRRGRALLKLGQISEASDAFCFVLSWQPSELEENNLPEENDRYGKDLARQAMKQVIFAKTLRERLVNGTCGNVKQTLQTAEELLSLCPYMRLVSTLIHLLILLIFSIYLFISLLYILFSIIILIIIVIRRKLIKLKHYVN